MHPTISTYCRARCGRKGGQRGPIPFRFSGHYAPGMCSGARVEIVARNERGASRIYRGETRRVFRVIGVFKMRQVNRKLTNLFKGRPAGRQSILKVPHVIRILRVCQTSWWNHLRYFVRSLCALQVDGNFSTSYPGMRMEPRIYLLAFFCFSCK